MLRLVLLVALAGAAFGSSVARRQSDYNPNLYTVSVLSGNKHIGHAAVIGDKYVLTAASLIDGKDNLKVRFEGSSEYSSFLSLYRKKSYKTIDVSSATVHPDWEAASDNILDSYALDFAVLELESSLPSSAKTLKLSKSNPKSGSEAFATTSTGRWSYKVSSEKVKILKADSCSSEMEDTSLFCASGSPAVGSPLARGYTLLGLAAESSKDDDLTIYSGVALSSVAEFIDAAMSGDNPRPEPTAQPDNPTDGPNPNPPTDRPSPSGETCTIEVQKGLPSAQPFIIKSDKLEIRNPDQGDEVILSAGEKVRLVCSGKGNSLVANGKAVSVAQCVSGTTFTVDGESHDFSSLACEQTANNVAQRSGTCLGGKQTRIDLGFEVGNDFVTLMENCFDSVNADPIYSKHVLTKSIGGYQSGYKRPQFAPDNFYSFDINKQYYRSNQQTTVGNLLGSSSLGTKYIQSKGNNYLARGHLTPKVDFVYGVEQDVTFHYVNAAPQFQSFNGVNWNYLEQAVRKYASSGTDDLDVVTGIWGTSTLPDENGNEQELYLYVDGDKKAARVPKYYWKIVINPRTKKGAVFVGLNNPYYKVTDEDIFCKNVCDRYSWLNFDLTSQASGYTFCCSVEEFLKTVTVVPDDLVKVTGLL